MPKENISMLYALKERAKKDGNKRQYAHFDRKIKRFEGKKTGYWLLALKEPLFSERPLEV